MRNFFQNIGYKLQQWMQGRYGMDELGRVLIYSALGFMILSLFENLGFLSYVSMVLMIVSIFRSLSKNLEKREKERNAYLSVKAKIVNFLDLQKRKWKDRKTYRYFKCKNCGKILRVPKGKGTIKIVCPGCKTELIKKT